MLKQIVIIGNGVAGVSAAEEISSHNKEVKIIMITDEPSEAYYRPMLSEYISEEEIPKRFFLHSKEWYQEMNIELLCNIKVTKIDIKSKEVFLDNMDKLSYDRLILSTGSHNFIPPINGPQKENIKSLRTLEDANDIKKIVQKSKRIVILGGGLLGLELGWQLTKLNCEVTVVEMMNRLLPKQLDEEASRIFEKNILKTGIKIMKNAKTKEILGESTATAVVLDNGSTIFCDLILYSIGVRANTQLADSAGLKINRGIIVNEYMQTENPDIFAAGDCAEYENINYAIWPEAMLQGKIAGKNAIGIKEPYIPIIPFNIYNGMNMSLFSIGDVGTNPDKKYETIQLGDSENYEKYYFVDNIFVGGILLGNIRKSAKLKSALNKGYSLEEFKASVLGE